MILQVFRKTPVRKEGGVSTSCGTVAVDLEEKSSSHLLFQVRHLCLHIVGSSSHRFKLPACRSEVVSSSVGGNFMLWDKYSGCTHMTASLWHPQDQR